MDALQLMFDKVTIVVRSTISGQRAIHVSNMIVGYACSLNAIYFPYSPQTICDGTHDAWKCNCKMYIYEIELLIAISWRPLRWSWLLKKS